MGPGQGLSRAERASAGTHRAAPGACAALRRPPSCCPSLPRCPAPQYVPPPHIIVRKGLIEGRTYPLLAAHLASFLAETLFHTSLLALPSDVLR